MSSDVTVTTMQLQVPFAQMLQQQQAQKAEGDANKDPSQGTDFNAKDGDKDFKGLMPKWMLTAGCAYAADQKFNSDDGKMGKFIQAIAKEASIVNSLAQALGGLQSFGALQSFLSSGGGIGPTHEEGEAGSIAQTLLNELNNFQTDGDDTQVEQEKSSECTIVQQEAQAAGTKAQNELNTTKNLTNQSGTVGGDENTVGDFIEQMAEGFGGG